MSRRPSTASGGVFVIEPARTVHARQVGGRHNRWRWALVALTQLVFYGGPWLRWDGQPAVLFDLEARRFHLFGAVLFPQDLIWLTVLLVTCALALFFATVVAGRVWCGFACPQTVYTTIFTWIEARCEGDRLARLRLDAAPWGPRKLLRRGGKQLLWGLFSLWTGLTLVGWFLPMPALLQDAAAGSLSPWTAFWVLFYALMTWLNAGVVREKVCLHMCPYGRFQGSLMDAHTLSVSYDARRGEPRGGRARTVDARAAGLGACVDCTLCVQVCPTGVDIRAGLQTGCINCGLCIDACNPVMDRLGQPRGLIRWASQAALATPSAAPVAATVAAWRRPRVWIYGSLLGLSLAALAAGLALRPTLRLDAMRDRSTLARETADGGVENVYRLLVMNASARAREVTLHALPGEGQGAPGGLTLDGPASLHLEPAQALPVVVRLRLDADARAALGQARVLPVRFEVAQVLDAEQALQAQADAGRAERVGTVSTFILPR